MGLAGLTRPSLRPRRRGRQRFCSSRVRVFGFVPVFASAFFFLVSPVRPDHSLVGLRAASSGSKLSGTSALARVSFVLKDLSAIGAKLLEFSLKSLQVYLGTESASPRAWCVGPVACVDWNQGPSA